MIRDIRDLVERLRKNDAKAQICTAHEPPHSIQGEAADEIERLRARLAEGAPSQAPRRQPNAWMNSEGLISVISGGGYDIPLYAFTVTTTTGSGAGPEDNR